MLLLCALAMGAIPATGCFSSMGGRGSRSSSSSDSDAFTGELTIENRSQLRICRLTMIMDDGAVSSDVELGQGDSTTLSITSSTNRLYVTECGNQRTLLGHPMNWYGSAQGRTELLSGLEQSRVVLYDPGQAQSGASDHRAIDLNPRPVSDWIFFEGYQDGGLARSLQDVITAQARRESWNETVEFTIPLSDWNIVRNRYTGVILHRELQGAAFARWPDGHCTMQAFGFRSAYNGSGFGNVTYGGSSTQLKIPCAALSYAAGLPTASPNSSASAVSGGASAGGSSSGGAMCTNTCNSSNDGECDDGGPGSLYSVCALGTDCADCGSRSGGAASGPASSPASSGGACTNTCNSSNDGECDDGGPGSLYSVCALGTDCADCGAR